jgi:hypothetical protein
VAESRQESRKEKRRRVLKEGIIQAKGLSTVCTVRNISATGALLIADIELELDQLTLVVVSENLIRKCKIIWHERNTMGVAFI